MAGIALARWTAGLAFDIDVQGHRIVVDAAEEAGGKGQGPRPKPLVLAGLAGCTGMDVVSMLQKMHMEFDSFAIEVDAQSAEEHPRTYNDIRIRYIFTGPRLEREKIEKAVRLSQDKYCGVSAMLRESARISYEIVENP